ncbi:uncharacterized protein HGUI_03134 [Hanseniaspora guilliermondii]|uniref:Nuclear mRNA export factor n=1 Tax=Hanseniaspora guilliermondii TaxID=56406 RepID=A0A1L0FN01_9ASCO|nr:uncharacterized protein HGUI_03134 [Hanseniaspora guilliermondii]
MTNKSPKSNTKKNPKQSPKNQSNKFPFDLYQTSPLVSNHEKLNSMNSSKRIPIDTPKFMKGKNMNIEPKEFAQHPWDVNNQKKMEKLIKKNSSNTQGLLDQLKSMREEERKKMETLKLVDSADASKSLKDAINFQGSCMQMCPIFECVRRDVENSLSKIEKDTHGNVDYKRAMKVFSRPAAFAPPPLPSDVRPPKVLVQSLDYIIDNLLDLLPENESFIWDRTRSIRQDFTLQNYFGPECVECNEKIVRIHILILHSMIKSGIEYSKQQELEQLNKTIITLCDIYDEGRKKGYVYPNEAEIRSYRCLLNPRDSSIDFQAQGLSEDVLNDDMFNVSMTFRRIMSNSSIRERGAPSKKKNGLNLARSFFQLIKDETKVPLLLAMFLENYVNEMRFHGLLKMKVSWSKKLIDKVSFDTAIDLFLFNNDQEIMDLCDFYNIEFDATNRTFNLSTLMTDNPSGIDQKKALSDVSLKFIDDKLKSIGSKSLIINMNRNTIDIKSTFKSPKPIKIAENSLKPTQKTSVNKEEKKNLRTVDKEKNKEKTTKTTSEEIKSLSSTQKTEKKENFEGGFNQNQIINNTPVMEFKKRNDLFNQTPSKVTPNNPTKIVNLEAGKKIASDSPGINVDEIKKNTFKIIYQELIEETSEMLLNNLTKNIVRNEVTKAKNDLNNVKNIKSDEPKTDDALNVKNVVVDKKQREMLLLDFLKSPTISNKLKSISNANDHENIILTPLKKVKRKLKISKELFSNSKKNQLILKNYINHVNYNMKSNTLFNKFDNFDICWNCYSSDWSDVSIKAILKLLNINKIPFVYNHEKINLKVCKYGINDNLENTQLLMFNTGINTSYINDFDEHMESERNNLIDILEQLKNKCYMKLDVLILFWKNDGLSMFDLKFFEKYDFVNSYRVLDIDDPSVVQTLELALNKISIDFDFKLNGDVGKNTIQSRYKKEISKSEISMISMLKLDEIQRSLRKARKVVEYKNEGKLFEDFNRNKKRKLSTGQVDKKKKYSFDTNEPLSSNSTFESPSASFLVNKNNIPTLNFGNNNQRKSTFNYKTERDRRIITPIEQSHFMASSSSPKM